MFQNLGFVVGIFFQLNRKILLLDFSLDSFAQRLFLSPGRQDGIFDQLLGTGGLVRAYSSAVKEGIAASKIGTMRYGVRLKICTDYNGIGKIQYILRQNGLEAEDTVYTDQVELTVLLAAECVPGLKKEITEATAAKAGIEEVEKLYFVAPDA